MFFDFQPGGEVLNFLVFDVRVAVHFWDFILGVLDHFFSEPVFRPFSGGAGGSPQFSSVGLHRDWHIGVHGRGGRRRWCQSGGRW